MPRAPKHCGKHDCLNMVVGVTFCKDHAHGWGKGNARTTTTQHRARRLRILERDQYLCRIQYQGCIGTATICDHIKATLLGGQDTDANCQAACKPCHDRKSSMEGHQAQGHRARP